MSDKINHKHAKGILDVIYNNPVYCFNDIFVYYKACSRSTAYSHNLDKLDDIKEAIYLKKRKGIVSLLHRWIEGDNATLQIAAMRIIGDDGERRKLNQQHLDIESGGDKITGINVKIIKTNGA